MSHSHNLVVRFIDHCQLLLECRWVEIQGISSRIQENHGNVGRIRWDYFRISVNEGLMVGTLWFHNLQGKRPILIWAVKTSYQRGYLLQDWVWWNTRWDVVPQANKALVINMCPIKRWSNWVWVLQCRVILQITNAVHQIEVGIQAAGLALSFLLLVILIFHPLPTLSYPPTASCTVVTLPTVSSRGSTCLLSRYIAAPRAQYQIQQLQTIQFLYLSM